MTKAESLGFSNKIGWDDGKEFGGCFFLVRGKVGYINSLIQWTLKKKV